MWYQAILTSIFPCLVLGFDQNKLKFGVEYFKHRDVKLICLLTCNNDISWSLQFYKLASSFTMAVGKVQTRTNFSLFERCLQQNLYPVGVLLDGGCEAADEILYYASQSMWLDANHKWLIIDDNGINNVIHNETESITDEIYNMTLIEVLANLSMSVDSDIVIGLRDNSDYILYDVFNFGRIQGGKLNVDEIGSWNTVNGFNLSVDLDAYKYYRRWDFQNMSMRIILVVQPAPKHFDPESLTRRKPVPGVAIVTQTGATILYVVARIHNFRFVSTITDRWISTYDKNSSKAVNNALYFRDQDISPVIRVQQTEQKKLDILITPMAEIETRYFYRIPTTGPGKFENQFLQPFSPAAWCCVIGVSALCAFILLLSALLEQRPTSGQYAAFSVIALISQQFFEDNDDSGTKRISTARKCTILVTGLTCMLMYNYYTSSVVSWLLNGPPPSINSLQGLLESPLELIFEDIGYTRSWLQKPKYYFNNRNAYIEDELRRKKVFNKKKGAPLLKERVEGIKMVQNGGYAYHIEVNSANDLISKTFTQSELCELGSLNSMEKTKVYPVLQKNSPYKEFMTWSLMRLTERGIVSCIQLRRSSSEVKCEGSSPRALALGGAAPAFILLAGGYMLATAIMIVERSACRGFDLSSRTSPIVKKIGK